MPLSKVDCAWMEGFFPKQSSADGHVDPSRDESCPNAPVFSFWIFNLSFAFYAMFATAFTFHIVSMGDEFGFQPEAMIRLFLPMATVSVLTNLCFGWIQPESQIERSPFVMNLGALAGFFGLYALNSESGVLAYVVGNGVAGRWFCVSLGHCLASLFWESSSGAISGVNMSTMVIASGLGPLIFGFPDRSWLPIAQRCSSVLRCSPCFWPLEVFGLTILSVDGLVPRQPQPLIREYAAQGVFCIDSR